MGLSSSAMPTPWASVPIPDFPEPAAGLADLLAHSGQWLLLAFRSRPGGGETLPAWEYPGIGKDWSAIAEARRALLHAAESNSVFLPQRATERGWEWLGIAFPPEIRPKAPQPPAAEKFQTFSRKIV